MPPSEKAATPERGIRFSPEIQLGHILQTVVILCGLIGWGLVGYQTIDRRLQQHDAEMSLMKMRIEANERVTAELRALQNATTAEIRQSLTRISEQLADLRTVVAGQQPGRSK